MYIFISDKRILLACSTGALILTRRLYRRFSINGLRAGSRAAFDTSFFHSRFRLFVSRIHGPLGACCLTWRVDIILFILCVRSAPLILGQGGARAFALTLIALHRHRAANLHIQPRDATRQIKALCCVGGTFAERIIFFSSARPAF